MPNNLGKQRMSNEITPLAANAPSPAASNLPAAAQAKAKKTTEKSAPELPKRAPISIDTAQMQRNLQEAIARMTEQAQKNKQDLSFQMDKVANRFVVTVKNSQTGEVIRQIPNEVVLKVAHNIEQIEGLLHNEVI